MCIRSVFFSHLCLIDSAMVIHDTTWLRREPSFGWTLDDQAMTKLLTGQPFKSIFHIMIWQMLHFGCF